MYIYLYIHLSKAAWISAEQFDKHEAEDGEVRGMTGRKDGGKNGAGHCSTSLGKHFYEQRQKEVQKWRDRRGASWPAETMSLALKLPPSVCCVSATNSKKIGNP